MISNTPTISIIVPIYNVGQYLASCLSSIEAQLEWKQQTEEYYEVILIDDGSTDNSGSIAEHYASKYPNWVCLHQNNSGLSAARNVGVRMAKGEYVCFIDSDDVIEADYLQRLYQAAIEHQADMVIADFYEIEETGRRLDKDKGASPYKEGVMDKDMALDALTNVGDCHYATAVVVAWNKLIRRKIMQEISYPEGKLHEDEFIIMTLLLKCDTIVWVQKEVYAYRQRNSSIMQDEKLAWRHLQVLDAFEERIHISRQLDKPDLHRKLEMSYFWDIEVWYFFMRNKYRIPWYKLYFYFGKRMWKAVFSYHEVLWKRKLMEYIIFACVPEYYLKHYYK